MSSLTSRRRCEVKRRSHSQTAMQANSWVSSRRLPLQPANRKSLEIFFLFKLNLLDQRLYTFSFKFSNTVFDFINCLVPCPLSSQFVSEKYIQIIVVALRWDPFHLSSFQLQYQIDNRSIQFYWEKIIIKLSSNRSAAMIDITHWVLAFSQVSPQT